MHTYLVPGATYYVLYLIPVPINGTGYDYCTSIRIRASPSSLIFLCLACGLWDYEGNCEEKSDDYAMTETARHEGL